MRLPFEKMHGAGNDFIMVAAARLPVERLTAQQIAFVCDRRRGVGGDGLIIVGATADADVAMAYYNADGGEAEMCGNGARCAVDFAHRLGLAGRSCRLATRSGLLRGRVLDDGIEVEMPVWRDLATHLTVAGSDFAEHHFCHTGVPHLVIPLADVAAVDVATAGRRLRHHELFAPAGANVDWISPNAAAGEWTLRTYERGVEAETLACGTGATAAAVILVELGRAASPVAVRTRGGDLLQVTVDTAKNEAWLRGPAVRAFEGEVWIDEF